MSMPCVAASLATADARFETSRSPRNARDASTASEPRTMKTSTATGMSASTLPRSSRMARLRIEAVEREPASVGIDDLGVPARRLDDAGAERADERSPQRRDSIADDDRVDRAPTRVRTDRPLDRHSLGIAAVALDRRSRRVQRR